MTAVREMLTGRGFVLMTVLAAMALVSFGVFTSKDWLLVVHWYGLPLLVLIACTLYLVWAWLQAVQGRAALRSESPQMAKDGVDRLQERFIDDRASVLYRRLFLARMLPITAIMLLGLLTAK